MRYLIRRLRKRLPDAKVILGCWTASGDTENLKDMVKADVIVTSLKDTVKPPLKLIH